MKFEKFLKNVGAHGQILKRANGDRWLICSGVGMKIPVGVENLLGSGEVPEKVKQLAEALINADTDDKVSLERASISKDGKASDIIRIFEDKTGFDIVGICNADFGLLEKSDVNLAFVEVEDENTGIESEYLLILDNADEVIGFISGVKEIK